MEETKLLTIVRSKFEKFWDEQVPKFEDFEWTNCGGKFPPLDYLGVPKLCFVTYSIFVTFPAPLPLYTTHLEQGLHGTLKTVA